VIVLERWPWTQCISPKEEGKLKKNESIERAGFKKRNETLEEGGGKTELSNLKWEHLTKGKRVGNEKTIIESVRI